LVFEDSSRPVARTIDPVVYAVRRDAFIDAAQRQIQARGYEQMSIQDLLDETNASRGAFYHYFDSKVALLDAVIDRMVAAAWVMLEDTVHDPGPSALEKLQSLFTNLAAFKNQRRDLLLGVLQVWLSDDNAIVREKFRRRTVARLTTLLAPILEEGRAEGTFTIGDARDDARVLASLMLGANEAAVELFIAHQAGSVSLDEVERSLTAYAVAFERLTGLPAGALTLIDPETLRLWFT
jgi:AcrR family transcriptional regulator